MAMELEIVEEPEEVKEKEEKEEVKEIEAAVPAGGIELSITLENPEIRIQKLTIKKA